MFICVNLKIHPPQVTLEDPADTKHFHVSVLGSASTQQDPASLVYAALVDAAAGRLEGEHAWIAVDAVRRLAVGKVGPKWQDDLTAMIGYAQSNNFYDEPGNALRAHVEWA